MDTALWLCCFLPILLVLYERSRQQKTFLARRIAAKRKKGANPMTDLVKNYVGRECLIYTMNSQLAGVIKEVDGSWITVDNGKDLEAVNLDYGIRIREYPRNKNGKKKAIVGD